MRKLFILIGLFFAISLSGQVVKTSVVYAQPSGGGTDTYGDCDNATADTYIGADYIWYFQLTVTLGGTITQFETYCGADAGGGNGLKIAVYSDNADLPNALIANGTANEIQLTHNSNNVITFTINPSVLSTTKYWIAFKVESNNYLQEGTGSILTKYEDAAYAAAFPATATPSAYTARDLKYCITVQH